MAKKNRKARTEDTHFADQKIGVLPHWAQHEGAEDFMSARDIKAMADIYRQHKKSSGGNVVDDALRIASQYKPRGRP